MWEERIRIPAGHRLHEVPARFSVGGAESRVFRCLFQKIASRNAICQFPSAASNRQFSEILRDVEDYTVDLPCYGNSSDGATCHLRWER